MGDIRSFFVPPSKKARACDAPVEFTQSEWDVFTDEQRAVITHPYVIDHVYRVNACAGSGKTTTSRALMRYESKRYKKCLYIAFNKAVQVVMSSKIQDCKGCWARTLHSLAFGFCCATGKKDQLDAQFPGPEYPDIGCIAQAVRETLEIFCKTAHQSLSSSHLPEEGLEKITYHIGDLKARIKRKHDQARQDLERELERTVTLQPQILDLAKQVWRAIIAGRCRITFNEALKLFQVSGAASEAAYDIVILDECQDANPCMLDIALQYRSRAAIILIGDENQMINGWNGACGTKHIPVTAELTLMKSFRFGESIATLAFDILSRLRPLPVKITANGGYSSIKTYNPFEKLPGNIGMILTRKNVNKIRAAMRLWRDGRSIVYNKMTEDYMKSLLALWRWTKGRSVNKSLDDRYGSVEGFWESKCEDVEVLVSLEDEGMQSLQAFVQTYKQQEQRNAVEVCTVHGAKGREMNSVLIWWDIDVHGRDKSIAETVMIAYVAVTRCKRLLWIPK